MKINIRKYIKLEQKLEHNKFSTNSGIKILPGKLPIVISAPHSVKQFRNGGVKVSESRTASIVEYLCEKTCCFGAYKTKYKQDDANFDEENYYKDDIMNLVGNNDIKLLIDLHIMAPFRKQNIEFGTGKGKNIFKRKDMLRMLMTAFEAQNIKGILVDELFTGGYKNTVSSTVSRKCGIPCFQIEMNWRMLEFETNREDFEKILNALTQAILDLERIL